MRPKTKNRYRPFRQVRNGSIMFYPIARSSATFLADVDDDGEFFMGVQYGGSILVYPMQFNLG